MLNKRSSHPQSEIPIRTIAEDFHPVGVAELDLYQKREKIYTRKIEGFYQRIRLYTGWPLLLGYFLLPWLNWSGSQAVLFDLPKRQFNIFSLTFWPQDFPLLALMLIIAAFTLFAVTAWIGRVWCGYTCPQTVWTAIFMWAEQFFEGSRNQRIKRDQGPWSRDKVLGKIGKHGAWIGIAFLTGFTFVGYFSPIREMSQNFFLVNIVSSGDLRVLNWGLGWWEIAWINFFTCATYINAGWMREQVCIYMCPYARFQSVMFDKDTLVVSYDEKRGESRGPRKKTAIPSEEGLGDCVDCKICVQVCPTGIDIRDGMQFECIDCALCIDGCNSVMDQMGYERGLISYTTENELEGKPTVFLRPRLIGYGIAVLLMVSLFSWAILVRVPLELDVIRDRDRLFSETTEGLIENSYTLKILNMDQHEHSYEVTFSGLDHAIIVGKNKVVVTGGEVASLPFRLQIDPSKIPGAHTRVVFLLASTDGSDYFSSSESRFIGPEQRNVRSSE
ncbi:MAG: cytochrome c oxidase accessory protein FixG [Gammaproteobacteria bacterium]